MSGIPGGHASTGNPVAVDVVAAALATATDGATVSRSGQPYGGSGILVAVPEHSMIFGQWTDHPDGLDLQAVRDWVEWKSATVTAPSLRPLYFGAWRDGGNLYLDVVEAFPDDEEAAAVAAGAARNQIAVWHAGRGEEIATGGTGA